MYVPTTSFESAPILVPIALPADSRHDAALLLGAEAIFWLGGGLGIAADWGVSASKVRTTSGGVDMTLSAKVNAGPCGYWFPSEYPRFTTGFTSTPESRSSTGAEISTRAIATRAMWRRCSGSEASYVWHHK